MKSGKIPPSQIILLSAFISSQGNLPSHAYKTCRALPSWPQWQLLLRIVTVAVYPSSQAEHLQLHLTFQARLTLQGIMQNVSAAQSQELLQTLQELQGHQGLQLSLSSLVMKASERKSEQQTQSLACFPFLLALHIPVLSLTGTKTLHNVKGAGTLSGTAVF